MKKTIHFNVQKLQKNPELVRQIKQDLFAKGLTYKDLSTEEHEAIMDATGALIDKLWDEAPPEWTQPEDCSSLMDPPKFGLERVLQDVFDFFRR